LSTELENSKTSHSDGIFWILPWYAGLSALSIIRYPPGFNFSIDFSIHKDLATPSIEI
jgi:hypothetical protein